MLRPLLFQPLTLRCDVKCKSHSHVLIIISVPESSALSTPVQLSMQTVSALEKAINTSALGLNPRSEGQELIVPIPR